MGINASHIVTVNPRLLEPAGTNLEFNGLFLTQSALIPTGDGLVVPFADSDSVAAYFGSDTDEHRVAMVYFTGYTGATKTPRALYFARRLDAAAAPFIRGGVSGTIAAIKAIVAGELTLTLGAHTATITEVDFASAGTFSDAARILQEAIRAHTAGGEDWTGATVTWSSLSKSFTITGGEAGEDLVVDYATGNVADALALTRAGGATLSNGSKELTTTEQMDAVVGITKNFVTFSTIWKATHTEMIDYASWATAQGINYLYTPWDDDPALLKAGNATTSAYALKEANVGATAMWWKGVGYAAFSASVAACIDWTAPNGSITFAFKSIDGLPASVGNITDATGLEAQGVNYIGDFATRNDQFILSYRGSMFGSWRWIDTYVSAVWLFNALQSSLMNGLKQTPRVPYTEKGYGLVRAWLQDPINQALNNGSITPGIKLSASQIAQVNREADRDIARTLENEGYFVQIRDPGPEVRASRGSPIVNFWYTDAGAIHKLEVTATALN